MDQGENNKSENKQPKETDDEQFNLMLPDEELEQLLKEMKASKKESLKAEEGTVESHHPTEMIAEGPTQSLSEEPTVVKNQTGPINKDVYLKRIDQKADENHSLMKALHEEFLSKLKYDEHKDKVIDKLHEELQSYKNDIIKRPLLSVFMDIIKIVDDINKFTTHYTSKDKKSQDPDRLLRYMKSIPTDLEDIFYWQGVESYCVEENNFDPARQRVLKQVDTEDPAKDKTIAERIRKGYEWDGKVIRPEVVSVYYFKQNSGEEDREIS